MIYDTNTNTHTAYTYAQGKPNPDPNPVLSQEARRSSKITLGQGLLFNISICFWYLPLGSGASDANEYSKEIVFPQCAFTDPAKPMT